MNNNKLSGLIIGGVLGFVFVITCTSPVVSEENESNDTNTTQDNIYCNDTTIVNVVNEIPIENGRYQMSFQVFKQSNVEADYPIITYYEVVFDTQTGEVVSRKYEEQSDNTDNSIDGLFTQI